MEPERRLSLRLLRSIIKDEKTTIFGKVNCYGGYVMFGLSVLAVVQYFGGSISLHIDLKFLTVDLSGPTLQDAIVTISILLLTILLWVLCIRSFVEVQKTKK